MIDDPLSSKRVVKTRQRDRVFIPLVVLLTIPVVILVAGVAVGAYFGLVETSRATSMRSKEAAADMVVKLNARSVVPAVVFGDEESMRRSIDDLAQNPEVLAADLWQVDAATKRIEQKALVNFRRSGQAGLQPPTSLKSVRREGDKSIQVWEPVIDPDGKTIAMLGARFSTEREAAATAEMARSLWYSSLGTALCLAIALILVLQRLVVAPIRRLQQAAELLGRGEEQAAQELAKAGRVEDEVVRLGDAFVEMSHAVQDREDRLALRNGELRLILDSVDQGFLTATPDGTLLRERSKVVETWVGALPRDAKVWDLAASIDPSSRGWTEMAWAQVVDGLLPLEMALEQLPKRLVRKGQHYDFMYHPVVVNEAVERIVIVMTNVTAEVERQRALAEQHEFSVLVDQFVRDRRAFFDFWNEATTLVERIVEASSDTPSVALRRDIHTLKGNARFFGLTRLSGICHALEDVMQERGENVLTDKERLQLNESWESLRRRIDPLVRGATAFLEISEAEYQRLEQSLRSHVPHGKLLEIVEGLRNEPTEWRLERAKKSLIATCKKLDKTPVDVVMEHHDLRVPPGRFDPFWSVVQHVLTNAIDHGLESDDERKAAGKPLPGRVHLSTRVVNGDFVVEISDDGRGIDWERVRARAENMGLPSRTHAELVNALLAEGFTLKEEVSTLSGRGVGLSALHSVLKALGGSFELTSEATKGCTWRFTLPLGHLATTPRVAPVVPRKTGSN